jgi:hypothetical protein
VDCKTKFKKMSIFNFNAIGDSLNESSLKAKGTGVSFAGKSLKLNNEYDGKLYFLLSKPL